MDSDGENNKYIKEEKKNGSNWLEIQWTQSSTLVQREEGHSLFFLPLRAYIIVRRYDDNDDGDVDEEYINRKHTSVFSGSSSSSSTLELVCSG